MKMGKWLAAVGMSCVAIAHAQVQTSPERSVRTTPEEVGLNVCNKSQTDAQFAVGYYANEQDSSGQNLYRSSGWYTVNAGTCNRIVKQALRYRFYYVHAMGKTENVAWTPASGTGIYLCVARDAFEFKEPTCGDGMNRRLFRILDTGESRYFTYNLN